VPRVSFGFVFKTFLTLYTFCKLLEVDYKIAFKGGSNPKIIGFILSNSGSSSPVRSFAVSVDEIERRTGINFFPQLEDGVENQIEGVVNYGGWNL
jgi:endonuclease G